MKTDWQNTRAQAGISVLLLVALVLGAIPRAGRAASDSGAVHEYQIKAAFLYNFLMFVEGFRFQPKVATSQQDEADRDRSVVLGVIGEDPFGQALEPLREKRIAERRIIIKRFESLANLRAEDPQITQHPAQEAVSQCDLLFVGISEEPCLNLILAPLAGTRALTVAEIPGFVERGGMIRLLTEQHKVRFEINVTAARRAHLEMRSKLLRLAKRVIEEDKDADK